MTPKERLIASVSSHHPETNVSLISQAYDYAERAHEGQKRLSGAPYFTHPLATAELLAEWHLPEKIVIAGLLHDVPEDTSTTPDEIQEKLQEIRHLFGDDVAQLVEGVTKLGKVQYRGVERYVENLRKFFLTVAKDVRVIFIKFADRITNLRDLNVVPEPKRTRIAKEALELYAPIANRLGMGVIRGELEDLSFQYLYPEEYAWTQSLVKSEQTRHDQQITLVANKLTAELIAQGIQPLSIHGRAKRLWSLYKKLLSHDRDIGQIYDIVALRVIVPTLQDCYTTLGAIHQLWRPLKGRIKDYIAQPKPNGYRSIHTTVFCDHRVPIEIQVRTPEIHDEAEYGIAAHWSYKEGRPKHPKDAHTAWLKELAAIQSGIADQKKFLNTLESLKIDFFNNRIFVLTPKGDVIDLPEGATSIDFAYAIHTDLGNSCVGSRINGSQATLGTPLSSGDVVEIIKDKNRKKPSADWLKFAKTKHAQDKIREHLRRTRLINWVGDLAKKATFQTKSR